MGSICRGILLPSSMEALLGDSPRGAGPQPLRGRQGHQGPLPHCGLPLRQLPRRLQLQSRRQPPAVPPRPVSVRPLPRSRHTTRAPTQLRPRRPGAFAAGRRALPGRASRCAGRRRDRRRYLLQWWRRVRHPWRQPPWPGGPPPLQVNAELTLRSPQLQLPLWRGGLACQRLVDSGNPWKYPAPKPPAAVASMVAVLRSAPCRWLACK